MIKSIERENTKVVIKINSDIRVEKYILPLEWECNDEMFAELLKEQLLSVLDKFKEEIAKEPYYYIDPEDLSKLKSKLVHEWNGAKHHWK